jgi:CDP-diacylglycerol--serine O-phosphatidyltransferase
VNFGVAPAIVVYLWSLHYVRGIGWAIAILFATCCALRLARFNSELEDPNKPRWMLFFFKGIPAPAAAGLALMPLMLSFVTGSDLVRSWVVNAVLLVFVAIMMISTVPTVSIKRIRIKPDHVLPVLLFVGMGIVFLVTEPWLTLSALGICYLLSIPVTVIAARRMRREEEAHEAATVEQAPATDDAAPATDDAAPGPGDAAPGPGDAAASTGAASSKEDASRILDLRRRHGQP